MRSSVRRVGNSAAVIIPKPMMSDLGVQAGDEIDITSESGKVVIAPIKRKSREGWAEAGRAIHAAGDDQLVWPEFNNISDKDWEW